MVKAIILAFLIILGLAWKYDYLIERWWWDFKCPIELYEKEGCEIKTAPPMHDYHD